MLLGSKTRQLGEHSSHSAFHIDSTGHKEAYKSVLETTIQAMLEKSLDGEFEHVKKCREWSSSIRRLSIHLKRGRVKRLHCHWRHIETSFYPTTSIRRLHSRGWMSWETFALDRVPALLCLTRKVFRINLEGDDVVEQPRVRTSMLAKVNS